MKLESILPEIYTFIDFAKHEYYKAQRRGEHSYSAHLGGFIPDDHPMPYNVYIPIREYLKKNAVCVAFDNEKSLTEIAMFIESSEFDAEDLLAYMRTKMPSYMIPTRLFFVPVFPLNSNDKTDKVKLKEMIQ